MIFAAKVGHTKSHGARFSVCGLRGGSDARRGLFGQSPADLQERGGLFFFGLGDAWQHQAPASAVIRAYHHNAPESSQPRSRPTALPRLAPATANSDSLCVFDMQRLAWCGNLLLSTLSIMSSPSNSTTVFCELGHPDHRHDRLRPFLPGAVTGTALEMNDGCAHRLGILAARLLKMKEPGSWMCGIDSSWREERMSRDYATPSERQNSGR